VVDLCAEISGNANERHYAAIPMLDLVAPTPDEITRAVHRIVEAHRHGPVLVACALGYSRSASAIVAWIVHTGREASIESAVERLRRIRPRIVLGEDHRQAVRAFLNTVPCDLGRIEPIAGPIPMDPALPDRPATR
jgi:protein-tyrosine phosphatase